MAPQIKLELMLKCLVALLRARNRLLVVSPQPVEPPHQRPRPRSRPSSPARPVGGAGPRAASAATWEETSKKTPVVCLPDEGEEPSARFFPPVWTNFWNKILNQIWTKSWKLQRRRNPSLDSDECQPLQHLFIERFGESFKTNNSDAERWAWLSALERNLMANSRSVHQGFYLMHFITTVLFQDVFYYRHSNQKRFRWRLE